MSFSFKQQPWLAWVALAVVSTSVSIAVVLAQKSLNPAAPTSATNAAPPTRHPVTIRPAPSAPRLDLGTTDSSGKSVSVACGTCHSTTTPNIARNSADGLLAPHLGLKYKHGNLTCLSCHNSTDYDTLRLADSRSLGFADVMTLCGQCHGPQKRDYDRGSHGGMNGHWDLTKGSRVRNNCVNCHDPHHPVFPLVLPVLPPRDRISVPKSSH